MFPIVTTVLLWVLIIGVLWYVLTQLITKKALARIGIVLLLLVIILAFFNPNDGFGGTWWRLLSLPLKPLGLGIFLLGFALRQGFKKVGGELVAVAFFSSLCRQFANFSNPPCPANSHEFHSKYGNRATSPASDDRAFSPGNHQD
ncbi:MAG: hypothetical protein HC916_18100 [Coleofasciculaceae cyanobacterium SM2_1_6]|nr:hypothetical protein [Coleofasciculaceae cyanobacterium SM2_1_6]